MPFDGQLTGRSNSKSWTDICGSSSERRSALSKYAPDRAWRSSPPRSFASLDGTAETIKSWAFVLGDLIHQAEIRPGSRGGCFRDAMQGQPRGSEGHASRPTINDRS